MYHKELNAQSPLRILERSIHGGLGRGHLGVVMARAGVGKTACLVQIGLDELMRQRPVFHVALGQTIEHVQSWYDALFEDLAQLSGLKNRDAVHAMITRHRLINALGEADLSSDEILSRIEALIHRLDLKPAAILIDGYDWARRSIAINAALLGALRAYARMIGAEVWMSAQTHRELTGPHPTRIPPPCDGCDELIDVAIFLEPAEGHVRLRLLKDHDGAQRPDIDLRLHPETMRLISDQPATTPSASPADHVLLSGGAAGAEAQFGCCAERWGLAERTFTFEGRTPSHSRGLVRLAEHELAQGAVSTVYLEARLHRTFPDTPLFRKILQTIWHQVNTAGEVFVVGELQPDGTVKGGTGWAAELGRHWNKPVHVFDQPRLGWFVWRDGDWQPEPAPRIRCRRFTGTGTRALTAPGRDAIEELFVRSFGPAPS
jgi:hypothetical protein